MADRSDAPPAVDRKSTSSHRRILCLDGGGIKGVLPASFLASIEEGLDAPIGKYFDLIVGTSTGGILGIGLALGIPAKDLLELYVQRGPYIFGQDQDENPIKKLLGKLRRNTRHITSPKHDMERLAGELTAVLKGARLGDACTRLVIPAWDADHRSPYVYKTAHHERLSTDYKKPALDAALATAAAPTYFKRHKTVDRVGLLDGGVWANNPIAIGVVEAVTYLGWAPSNLDVLSLGCSEEVYMLSEAPGVGTLGLDALKLFMDGQSGGAMGMAKLLTGHADGRDAIYRYSPMVPKGFFKMDDASKIDRLNGMGAAAARKAKPTIQPIFFGATAAPFNPVYTLERSAA